MQALQVKATLQDTLPAVWRTLHFHPETGLEQVHDMLLIVMGWEDEHTPAFATNDGPITPEDDAYHEGNLNDYLTKPGDLLSYGLDSDDDYHIELELTAIVDTPDDAQLPRLIDGANPVSPTDQDTTIFNLEALNAEASELFDGETSGPDLLIQGDGDNDFDLDDIDLTDVDAGQEITFEFEWLEREHGIKVSDDNVHNLPQDLLDHQQSLTEADLENPRRYLKGLEPFYRKYPEQPMLSFEVAALYGVTGDQAKSRRIFRELEKNFPDHLELLTTRLNSYELDEEFLDAVSQLPHPLDIRNHPASESGYYHTSEFLAFEELAIREAIANDKLDEARQRLDRLVRFGFLHGDVEQAALLVGGLTLVSMEEMVHRGEMEPGGPLPDTFSPVSVRTDAILEVSMEEAAAMFIEMEEDRATPATVQRTGPKVGRNDPCPCGSGRKHKKCCR